MRTKVKNLAELYAMGCTDIDTLERACLCQEELDAALDYAQIYQEGYDRWCEQAPEMRLAF